MKPASIDKLTKKIESSKRSPKIKFEKKDHKEQHKVIVEIDERIDDTLDALEDGRYEDVKKSLDEGKKLIQYRNKSSLAVPSFVESEINELLAKGCIKRKV